MSDACGPQCGYCGMCTAAHEGEPLHFSCFWCGVVVISQSGDEDHYPYCSTSCAVRAELNARDPREQRTA